MNNLVINDSGIENEAVSNMQVIDLSDKKRHSLGLNDIKIKINKAIKSVRSISDASKVKNLYFYIWHDFQAGQLRFSFISKPNPPFANEIKFVKSMDEIINDFLEETGGLIELDKLSELPTDIHEENECVVLKVYIEKI